MSDLQRLFSAQDKTARWKAEMENATARLELARIEERSAYLISQAEPVNNLLINRGQLKAVLSYLHHGNLNRLKEETEAK